MNVSQTPALHLFRRTLRTATFSSLALLGSIAGASAQLITVDIDAPTIDKNGYPHSPNGGATNPTAFIFGSVGTPGFDDRASQFFNRFSTSATVPTGLGSANYQIVSATFTLSLAGSAADLVVFDGTYDPYTTYNPADGEPVGDSDPGRPIELYGAGFRNGITKESVTETLAFGPSGEGTRNIYATDFQLGSSLNGTLRDVGNNIALAFDPVPFAIGQVALADLNPNGTIKEDANVVFTLNLSNPDVLRYLQLSLDAGSIDFLVTSLHPSSQTNPTNPYFYTKESSVADVFPGRLDLQVVVPEPSAITFLLCSFGLFVGCWRGRQALQSGVTNI